MTTATLAISYFFHLVATVVWIGGLLILLLLVYPEARRALGGSSQLVGRLRRRFLPLSHFSLVVLLVTGMIQMSGDSNYQGMLQFDNDWSRVILLKHIAIGVMLICGVILQYVVLPALERAHLLVEHGKADAQALAPLHRRESWLMMAALLLGILVLGLSAWATAL
jgi:putative copper export protein